MSGNVRTPAPIGAVYCMSVSHLSVTRWIKFFLAGVFIGAAITLTAAEVLIENTPEGTATSHDLAGFTTVFTSDQVGYRFYRGSNGTCYYRKTTDGAATWGSAVQFNSLTSCANVAVWYDQWTPGDTGTNIHIVSMHPSDNSLRYNRLNTSGDTLLVAAGSTPNAGNGQTPTVTLGGALPTITKGTDGTVYVAISDNSDAYVNECSASCNVSTSWTETGANPMDAVTGDMQQLLPLAGGNIMLISRDRTADDIRTKIWNNSSWDTAWALVDGNAGENSEYELALSAVQNPNNGRVYMAYVSDNNNYSTADHDIRTAYYNGSTWVNTTDITTNDSRGLTHISLAIDSNTNDVYVVYGARTTVNSASTANVYWASSTSAMSSWAIDNGPLNVGADDIYGISTNYRSNQRLYASWFELGSLDIRGETVVDISPPLTVFSLGTQQTEVRAGTNNFYLGGSFAMQEFGAGRSVTSITITETGSVNGASDLDNIRLLYEMDTTEPYDCQSVSYGGGELQFGATDTNGFSGGNGVSTFADSVTVTSTSSLCVYVLVDVLDTAIDGQTVGIEITNPNTDVLVTGADAAQPNTTQAITGDTTVVIDSLRQTGYHWRNDNGSETGATSATAGEQNTPLIDLTRETPRRLRIAVTNDGSTSTDPTTLRLEYGVANPACTDVGLWIDVHAGDDAWNMFDSTQFTHGGNTTDIATSSGGVSNPNTFFKTPNGGLLDTTSQTSALSINDDEFVEYEFSIVASTTAQQGENYCFRLTAGGVPLDNYTNYPEAAIAANVHVETFGTQIPSAEIGTANIYAGGGFAITEAAVPRNVTSITITETGSIDAANNLANIDLFYELDTVFPYNCEAESYSGTEAQFGSTVAGGFDAANGIVSFSDSVGITPTSTLCTYVVYDVLSSSQNGDVIDLEITNPSTDVQVSGGAAVAPTSPVAIASSTAVSGAIVTQTHYHWRNDDGDETGATSATGGSEDTSISGVTRNEAYRLRIGLSNEGGTSTPAVSYRLQFGIKVTECSVIATWTDVNAFTNDSWDMFDSTFLTHGEDTTDIPVADGGVSDEEALFLTPNSGVRETDDTTATTTVASNNYVDYEFTLTTTANTPYETDFCFRLIENGQPLTVYSQYAEARTRVNRDFKIQRGAETVSGPAVTLTAGVDYEAPAATSSAFIRITGVANTGAGNTVGGNQSPDDTTAYIDTSDLTSSFTIVRDTDSSNNTRVAWEIVEFIGTSGTDNEMVVHEIGTRSLTTGETTATSGVVTVNDDDDVVVFVTGAGMTNNTRTNHNNILFTSDWSAGTGQAILERGVSTQDATVGYAIVEFVGQNWNVQRVEHAFAGATSTEFESIAPVTAVTQAFVVGQKRMGDYGDQASFGVEIWLSSMGAVSFRLDSAASTPTDHVGVAWVVENTQSDNGEMVVFQTSGTTSGGTEPFSDSITFDSGGVNATSNASIFVTANNDQATQSFPQALASFIVTSTTTYELWRSDTGSALTYRADVVEWPAADVAVRQNYYRWYENTNGLTPSNPWPPAGGDLGENTSITVTDTPVGDGDVLRLRMSYRVANGTLPANLKTLKLQYGLLGANPSCSAVGTWTDVGTPGSGAIWRGFDNGAVSDGAALGTNPPTGGQVVLSVSDRAGRYVEGGLADPNPYTVQSDEDVEYDWVIQHNGATQRSDYCFRTVQSDGIELDGYLNYPSVRTQGYAPEQRDWRWYGDSNTPPTTALAAENVAPVEVAKGDTVRLRILIDEVNNLSLDDARFRLQYSETNDFAAVADVASIGTCGGSDVWCYADGPGVDNVTITSAVLTNTDACTAGTGVGCGAYVESPLVLTGYTHEALSAAEFDFAVQYQNVSGYYGQVWYFRIYDSVNNAVVPLSSGASYPSLVGESGSIAFSVAGLELGTSTEGIVTDVATTPTNIPFGSLELGVAKEAGQRLVVDSNSVGGYRVLMRTRQLFENSNTDTIVDIAASNEVPDTWSASCGTLASCFGYHAGDDTLSGTTGRFALDDTYAAASTTAEEIMYSATPVSEQEDIIYKLLVRGSQPPGDYSAEIIYVVVPQF